MKPQLFRSYFQSWELCVFQLRNAGIWLVWAGMYISNSVIFEAILRSVIHYYFKWSWIINISYIKISSVFFLQAYSSVLFLCFWMIQFIDILTHFDYFIFIILRETCAKFPQKFLTLLFWILIKTNLFSM